MNFVKEETTGLHSALYFHCDNCDKTVVLSSDHPSKQKDVNKSVVWGYLNTVQKAGKEKKQHAIDKVNLTVVDRKEIPYITVIVNGGWSKP
ncbi:hypothetical protein ILUMI_02067 [Ignelater luminosus]|uniref:Uncharacterized protein n=1 Tax=Ignelater luminosus TaxID=2038154 RepID=A0A8K0DH80_IGNLU|nr:hypothetical protein ILUMI_02067 [Ignelater luminosus]